MYRADRVWLTDAQRPQRGGIGFAFLAVNFVGGQEHRLARAAQDTSRSFVTGGRADDRVHHQDHRVGGTHGHRCLLGYQQLQALGVGLPSPGVLDDEPASGPQRVVGHPVTGHPGHVLNDGFAPTQDPIDQRRLADVRPAHDRHHRWRTTGHIIDRINEFS